jgi:hypothetical protein
MECGDRLIGTIRLLDNNNAHGRREHLAQPPTRKITNTPQKEPSQGADRMYHMVSSHRLSYLCRCKMVTAPTNSICPLTLSKSAPQSEMYVPISVTDSGRASTSSWLHITARCYFPLCLSQPSETLTKYRQAMKPVRDVFGVRKRTRYATATPSQSRQSSTPNT